MSFMVDAAMRGMLTALGRDTKISVSDETYDHGLHRYGKMLSVEEDGGDDPLSPVVVVYPASDAFLSGIFTVNGKVSNEMWDALAVEEGVEKAIRYSSSAHGGGGAGRKRRLASAAKVYDHSSSGSSSSDQIARRSVEFCDHTDQIARGAVRKLAEKFGDNGQTRQYYALRLSRALLDLALLDDAGDI
jgi:hypothetical protein